MQIAQRQTNILETLQRSQLGPQDESPTRDSVDAEENTISRDQLQRTTWDLLRSNRGLIETSGTNGNARTNLASLDPKIREADSQLCGRLVESLFFENLGYRKEAIAAAHVKTFEWIFQEPQLDAQGLPAWSNFPRWLEDDTSEIYWITGKPGAGKSTLVKFILGHPSTLGCLSRWASRPPLLILGYYFWNAGSELQKSHEGLLRTMLFQALDHQPDLVPRVLFPRWAMMKLFGDNFTPPRWDVEELMTAFQQLISEVTKKGKILLVIDGLDEFQGSHHRLVDLIRDISTRRHLKICVSSRPWNVFRDAFVRSPSLAVENLTRDDIDLYVRDHFGGSEGFRELRAMQTTAADALIRDVVDKAQGVFLWIKVVVAALLEGLSEGDRLAELQRTLDDLPEDLSQLFQAIWDRIDSRYHDEASQLFQIMEEAAGLPWGLSALTLWLSDKDHDINMTKADVDDINQEAVVLALKRRLSSRTKGLLEIHPDNRVNYMHRSVFDWIAEHSGALRFASSPEFDPHLALLKGETLRMVGKHDPFGSTGHFWDAVSHLFRHASHVKEDMEANMPLFFSALDRVNIELTRLSPPLYGNPFSPSSRGGPVLTPLPHWSCLQFFSRGLNNNTVFDTPLSSYIGFTAQIPLTAYVRAKVLADPNLNPLPSADTRVMNLVEAAAFEVGCSNCVKRGRSLDYSQSRKSDEDRLQLIRFLIIQGLDPSRLAARLRKDVSGWWMPQSTSWKMSLLQAIQEEATKSRPSSYTTDAKPRKRVARFLHRLTRLGSSR